MDVQQYLLVSLIHIVSAQFPTHVDLQKVGEIIFNNEKYNVLKPSVHKVTDHFKDFMMRRENKHPNERVFIDDNGLRHFWSGFGIKQASLRKTGVSQEGSNVQDEHNPEVMEVGNAKTGTLDKDAKVDETVSNAVEPADEALRQAQKKLATAYFYCPFFGVMELTEVIT